ncbi:obg-like ATPase 1 [Silene latifolia]|uniref:obg-like ATPase 1 n=1 Tax=Silene latifolia TaxID=37657 RepID=UPI003D780393
MARRREALKKRVDAGGRILGVAQKLRKPAYLFSSAEFDGIHAWVHKHGGEQIFPFSGAFERNLADVPEDEAARYCEENKVQSGIPKIIKTGFSAGPDKVKCWQIRRQTKASQAAGTIHTDFERGFICDEVMKFEDVKELGSESTVKCNERACRQDPAYDRHSRRGGPSSGAFI